MRRISRHKQIAAPDPVLSPPHSNGPRATSDIPRTPFRHRLSVPSERNQFRDDNGRPAGLDRWPAPEHIPESTSGIHAGLRIGCPAARALPPASHQVSPLLVASPRRFFDREPCPPCASLSIG